MTTKSSNYLCLKNGFLNVSKDWFRGNIEIARTQSYSIFFREAKVERFAFFFRVPAHLASLFDDIFDHVWAENSGALDDDLLAVGKFVKFDANSVKRSVLRFAQRYWRS